MPISALVVGCIELWCNGNTSDFGSEIRGSNPRSSTMEISKRQYTILMRIIRNLPTRLYDAQKYSLREINAIREAVLLRKKIAKYETKRVSKAGDGDLHGIK